MSDGEAKDFEGWAILELMGHRKLAGHVSTAVIGGAALLRIDVPCTPPVTQFYGGAVIYCMTPTSEDVARRFASNLNPAPVHQYELAPPRSQEGREMDPYRDLHDDDDDEDA